MNKQEAIERIESNALNIGDNDLVVGLNVAKHIINQIDEPQKVTVPKFVADWYEEHKDNFEFNVQCLCVHSCEPVREIDIWFDSDYTKPIETLVMMHKFGYEVEKEKLYTAMLKISCEYLHLDCEGNFGHFRADEKYISSVAKAYHFTEDDLVKYHIWGNDNYEVKEVEDD